MLRAGFQTEIDPLSCPNRAFYLEKSNLPTDSNTTAMKIDQVNILSSPCSWRNAASLPFIAEATRLPNPAVT